MVKFLTSKKQSAQTYAERERMKEKERNALLFECNKERYLFSDNNFKCVYHKYDWIRSSVNVQGKQTGSQANEYVCRCKFKIKKCCVAAGCAYVCKSEKL